MGITSYYRRFVPNYSDIAAPLTDLTKKNAPNKVSWTPSCEQAFNTLKEWLYSEPLLKSPDFERPFILQTDASEQGVGAVLSQQMEDIRWHTGVGNFYLKHIVYSTIEKECLAIKLAVGAFSVYLLGRPFSIETDHRSLTWMERLKHTNNQLARWTLALQPFQFNIRHRAGKYNENADALSRATN